MRYEIRIGFKDGYQMLCVCQTANNYLKVLSMLHLVGEWMNEWIYFYIVNENITLTIKFNL